jgi:hypothetical protein
MTTETSKIMDITDSFIEAKENDIIGKQLWK